MQMLNGTPCEWLYGQAAKTGDLLRQAREALAEMAPNGRDYCHPGGDEEFSKVRQQHREADAALRAVQAYVLERHEAIADSPLAAWNNPRTGDRFDNA
jgi:hypothetical protein